jgi:hypothetical protein
MSERRHDGDDEPVLWVGARWLLLLDVLSLVLIASAAGLLAYTLL